MLKNFLAAAGIKPLASKLEALAKKYAGSYYGEAASKSVQSYKNSQEKKLTDERQR